MKLFCQLIVLLALGCLLSACDSRKSAVNSSELPAFVAQKGNVYTITQGQTRLDINAGIGGRISSLKVDGVEMLLTADKAGNTIWGSTFWSSPQSEWSWPPIDVLDAAPYSLSVVDDRIVFTSKTDPGTGYQFIKSYGINAEKKCISIIYSIYNKSNVEKNVAGWEVTRFRPTGMTFFPQGNTESNSGIFYPLVVEHMGDITWANYRPEHILQNHHKLMTDGKEGWVAYANAGKILVKEFADVPVELIVAGEGEIELFANVEKTFWEVDQQGVMTKLAPGEHLDWEVRWHTRSLPASVPATLGSEELVNFVRGVLNGTH
ncbi:hypothetical protein GCM10011613_09200 [Cellvibrio zantedeschiae]|uniref:DUF4380 domain-containing protein n=1 Tax=Cellvibrio zantedeschiae TaxID=1237077 RepID=A0ABQ3AXG9_9GAMM|nr:DUF4380 domain-containing protein [Cellvibrio zantedeschiae]GGY67252.1 hypothetical protein GCM10011613_09200 [Cellvibrio zantedeschiae]